MKAALLFASIALLLAPVDGLAQSPFSHSPGGALVTAATQPTPEGWWASGAASRFMQSSAQSGDPENWVSRHLVLVGTLAGTAGGGVVAINVGRGEPAIILGGAAAGAYGGLIASAIHNARRDRPVGRRTKMGIALGAIGIGVAALVVASGLGGV